MEQRVTFTAHLNDGGNGHRQTFTLAELGIDPEGLSPEQLEAEIVDSYNDWVAGHNQGGWDLLDPA